MIELKTPVEVILWGEKATIASISWRKQDIWHKYDTLLAWLDLSKPAYGVTGFGVSLPVKDYNKQEFLEAVIREGESQLQAIADRRTEEIERKKQEEEKAKELDTIVQNIVNQLAEG